MRNKGLWVLNALILGFLPSILLANQAEIPGNIRPKLLLPSATPTTISLEQALERSLAHHASLKLIENQRAQKQTEKWMSIGNLLPKLKLTSSYTHNIPEIETSLFDVTAHANLNRQVASLLRNSGDSALANEANTLERHADLMARRGADKAIVINPKHVVDAKLSLEIPLFDGANVAKTLASHENSLLYDTKVSQEKANTLFATAKAYASALYAHNVWLVHRQAHIHAEKLFNQFQNQRKSPRDVKVVKAYQDEKEASQLLALLDYRTRLAELGIIIGMGEEFSLVNPKEEIFASLNISSEELFARALAERHDLKASLMAQKMSEGERLGHYLKLLPSLWLKGDGNYTSNDKGLISEKFTYAISINASISLFDGGMSLFALRQNALKRQENEIRIRELKNNIDAGIRGHRERLALLALLEKANASKLEVAFQAAKVAHEKLDRQRITHEEYLEIEDKKLKAELMYKKSQSDNLVEKLTLIYEAGLLNGDLTR